MVNGNYDDPDVGILRELVFPAPPSGSGVETKYALYANAVLKRARAVVRSQGTSTDACLYIVSGTNTHGSLVAGTADVGSIVSATLSRTAVTGNALRIVNGADDNLSIFGITLEYKDAF